MHCIEVNFMSPQASAKGPVRLLNIRKYPDVFKALLVNAHVIARDLKEHYLVETDSLAGRIKEIIEAEAYAGVAGRQSVLDGSEIPRRTEAILESLRGQKIGTMDGGLG